MHFISDRLVKTIPINKSFIISLVQYIVQNIYNIIYLSLIFPDNHHSLFIFPDLYIKRRIKTINIFIYNKF